MRLRFAGLVPAGFELASADFVFACIRCCYANKYPEVLTTATALGQNLLAVYCMYGPHKYNLILGCTNERLKFHYQIIDLSYHVFDLNGVDP